MSEFMQDLDSMLHAAYADGREDEREEWEERLRNLTERQRKAMQRPAGEDRERAQFKALKKRANKARDFPANTDSASRHAYIMAENKVKKHGYPMLAEEPWHCAISIMATVALLWETRTTIASAASGNVTQATGQIKEVT